MVATSTATRTSDRTYGPESLPRTPTDPPDPDVRLPDVRPDVRVRTGWAYLGIAVGGVVSIAANVAHSYVPPVGASSSWRPQAGAVLGAVFWPVALFVAIEIMARTTWPDGKRWVLLRFGGLAPVAVVAAVVSYRHLSGLLAFYGEDWMTVRFGPLAVDGLMVMATGALLAANARPRRMAVLAEGRPSYEPTIPARPEDGVAVVYRLFDATDALLYVGCTVNPWVRLKEHRRMQPWWSEVVRDEIVWFSDINQAADTEAAVIHDESPAYNYSLSRYAIRNEKTKRNETSPENPPTVSDVSRSTHHCESCDRPVSRAAFYRHRKDGCPAPLRLAR